MMNTHEWPLVIFTVLSQGAIGAFCWCFIALMACQLSSQKQTALQRSMIVLWVMMGVAFALSTMHLGSPLRAMNALFRAGASPLSNEIVTAAAFSAFGGLSWLLSLRRAPFGAINKVLLLITLVCSFLFMYAMSQVYRIPTVPLWDTPLTLLSFVATALIVGSVLAYLLFQVTQVFETATSLRSATLLVAGVGIVLALVVAFSHIANLQTVQFPLRDGAALTQDITCWTIAHFVVLFVAIALWGCQLKCKTKGVGLIALCLLLALAGEMMGRLVFYSLNMTVGLI